MTGQMIDEQMIAAHQDLLRKRLNSYSLWASVSVQQETFSVKVSVELRSDDSLDTELLQESIKSEVSKIDENADLNLLAAKIYTMVYAHHPKNSVRIRFRDNNNSEMLFEFL